MSKLDRRNLGRGAMAAVGAAWVAGLPKGAWAALAADDPLLFVNPQLRPAAREMLGRPFPPFSDDLLPGMRKMGFSWTRPPLPAVPVETRTIPGLDGGPEVAVIVINRRPDGRRPAILHTHGGGFIIGAARQGVRDLQETAQALDCVIVTVDYRLAPETRWRGSVADNVAGLLWLHGHAAELGVDPERLAVMGESAGGGHAALLAIQARDRGIGLRLQALIYPMLDDRTGSVRTPAFPIGALLWTADSNRYGWRSFLGVEPGSAAVPAAAVPARTASLAGLAPAFIGVGSIDLFVDEDLDYARRLVDAGVPTQVEVAPGAFHGFDGIAPETPVAQAFTAAKRDALRTALSA